MSVASKSRYGLIPLLGSLLALPSMTTQAAFLDDSKTTLSLRSFYINQDSRNESTSRTPRSEEWGQAYRLDFKSGFTEGVVGFGLDIYAMQGFRLDGGGRAGKAGMERTPGTAFPLESNGKAKRNFGRLGVTGKMRFSKTVAEIGTLLPRMPVLVYNDGRLLPQMFRGAQITSNEIKDLKLTLGKIEQSIERNSSDGNGLSIAGANSGAKARFSNEFYYGGVDYQFNKDLLLQYYHATLRDFYKQHFLGITHKLQLPVGSLTTDLRYFNNDSDGENASASGRLKGYRSSGAPGSSGEVDNSLWSAQFTYSLRGHALSAGYQKVSGNSDFPDINLGSGRNIYVITNAQLGKFVNAGENTWVVGYAYDFASLGIPGLKSKITYYSGDDIDAAGSDHREWERNIRLDYSIQEGMLKGVGLTWMNAAFRGNDARNLDENRLIVNYSIPLF